MTARMHKGFNSTADGGQTPVIAFDPTQITHRENRSNPQPGDPQPGDPCHTLAKSAHAPAIAWTGDGAVADPITHAEGKTYTQEGTNNFRLHNCVQQTSAVRRLTPTECERLMGFPDDYTAIPFRGKPAADGPRYKALGNSWAVNCARWIGRRIAMVDEIKQNITNDRAA